MDHSVIMKNVKDIRERMASAAGRVGRDPREITLVAATKQNDAAAVQAAIFGGVDAVGENRVQEMMEKEAKQAYVGAPLHFIGHLQTNKVKQVVGRVALIQSVGSLRLAQAVNLEAQRQGIRQNVLMEINVGAEDSKSGVLLAEVANCLTEFLALPYICVCGIMAIPPIVENEQLQDVYFRQLEKVYVDIRTKLLDNTETPILSMGMSGDFEQAIEAGATMVRVGSALFGHRQYNEFK